MPDSSALKSNAKNQHDFSDVVIEASIPTKPNQPGVKRGFGFIQFKDLEMAKRAVELLDGKEVFGGGRKIGVGIAVAKGDWELTKQGGEDKVEGAVEEVVKEVVEGGDVEMEEAGLEVNGDVEMEEAGDVDQEDESAEAEEDDEEEDGHEEELEDDDVAVTFDNEDNDEGDEEKDDEEEEEDEEIKLEAAAKKPKTEKKNSLSADVNDKATLFIRNLAFETTEEELKEK
jgi:RNA recognition motif-containing protein